MSRINAYELHCIHEALHDADAYNVSVRGLSLNIARASSSERRFSKVTFGQLLFITQNLGKGSTNSAWVRKDIDNRNLTWVIHQDRGYLGKIQEWVDDNGETHIEYHRFKEHGADEVYADDKYWSAVEASRVDAA